MKGGSDNEGGCGEGVMVWWLFRLEDVALLSQETVEGCEKKETREASPQPGQSEVCCVSRR